MSYFEKYGITQYYAVAINVLIDSIILIVGSKVNPDTRNVDLEWVNKLDKFPIDWPYW